jgi:polar amino acid transport system permease protein
LKNNAFIRSAALAALLFLFLCSAALASGADDLMRKAGDAVATGDLDTAVQLYMQVPAPDGDGDDGQFVNARMQAARMHFALKRYDKALEAVDSLLAVYPDNIEAKSYREAVNDAMMPQWKRLMRDTVHFVPALLKGSLMTLLLVFFTMVVSPVGGLFIALGRISGIPPVSRLCWFIIWIFRGTPLLLQLFFIYYGLPAIGITLKPIPSALLGLGLNYSAYLAEIIRSGIQSIDKGQMEAAEAMGMSYRQAMRRVIIPQTYRVILPPVTNEFIALIKDTALVSTIAMVELMRTADQLFNASFNVTVLALAACVYLLFTTVFTFAFERLERRVGAYEER